MPAKAPAKTDRIVLDPADVAIKRCILHAHDTEGARDMVAERVRALMQQSGDVLQVVFSGDYNNDQLTSVVVEFLTRRCKYSYSSRSTSENQVTLTFDCVP